MKIYVDLAQSCSLTHNRLADKDCPSPEACTEIFPSFPAMSLADLVSYQQKLQQARMLYIQKCQDEHWLACCTSGSGQMAVLDREALGLLEQFSRPLSLGEILQTHTAWSQTTLQEVISLFYRLGLLHKTDLTPENRKENPSSTLTVWLHVTNACNLRCNYCYIQKTQEHMQADTGHKAIDAVFRSALLHNITAIHLKYAGGEASLHMQGVVALHDYALQLARKHKITLSATLLSNGVSLSERSIDNLQKRHIGVLLSLDGLGSPHDSQRRFLNGQGSYKYVQRTIARLLAKDLVPSIYVTISRRNLHGLPALIQYLLEHELPFSLNYFREHNNVLPEQNLRTADQEMIAAVRAAFQVIEKMLPKYKLLDSLLDKAIAQVSHLHTCGMGRNYLVIDQRGGVAKCQAEMESQVTTIEHADPLQAVREDTKGAQNLGVDEKEGCRSCDWRYWCTGGCPLLTYQVTGRNDIRSPNCHIYKTLFPDVLRLEALRLLTYQSPLLYKQRSEYTERPANQGLLTGLSGN